MPTTTAPPQTSPQAAGPAPLRLADVGAGLRHQIAPWTAMGCLLVAASASRIAVHATGHQAEVASTVAMVAFATAVVVSYSTRRRPWSRKLRHRFLAACYLAATWLTWVTVNGFSGGALASLVIVGSCLSLLYWREHRIGNERPTLAEMPVFDDGGDLYADRWNANIGAPGRQFAGATLGKAETIKAGYRYTGRLVPGRHTVGALIEARGTVRGGLELLPGQDHIVEEHPTLPSPAFLLTIVTRPQVAKPQPWPGPDKAFEAKGATGAVRMGPFVDGEETARFTVYKQDGMFGGYVQGGNGSGKSRLIDSLAMSLTCSETHPTVIWYGDGQNGRSSPLLAEHADWPALRPEAVYEMLAAGVRVMGINGAAGRVAKRVGFHPTPQTPGLLIIIDECHAIFDPNRNPLLAKPCQILALMIAREGRKEGVALLMASQSPTLDAFGGAGSGNGADTLRACLLQGNGVILRSKTRNAKQVFGVDVEPRNFPKLPGYGYLADPEEGARSAPFRSYWVTDDMAAVWPRRIKWRTLSPRQAAAAGPTYARRHEVAAEQTAHDELMLRLADEGRLADYLATQSAASVTTSAAAGTAASTFEGDDAHPPIRLIRRFWLERDADGQASEPEVAANHRKVLDAIASGNTRPRQIATATDYSEAHVYNNLIPELTRLGLITRVAYGEYRLTDDGAAQVGRAA